MPSRTVYSRLWRENDSMSSFLFWYQQISVYVVARCIHGYRCQTYCDKHFHLSGLQRMGRSTIGSVLHAFSCRKSKRAAIPFHMQCGVDITFRSRRSRNLALTSSISFQFPVPFQGGKRFLDIKCFIILVRMMKTAVIMYSHVLTSIMNSVFMYTMPLIRKLIIHENIIWSHFNYLTAQILLN